MTKKMKLQLAIPGGILLLLIALFAGISFYEKHGPAEEDPVIYQVTNVKPEDVKELGINNADGSIDFIKKNDGWSYVEDPSVKLNETALEDLIANAGSITSKMKIENVADMEQYGLKEPAVSVTLQWDSNMYTIKLGDYNSIISSYYVSVNDEASVYTIDSTSFYALNKSLSDLEQKNEEIQTE